LCEGHTEHLLSIPGRAKPHFRLPLWPLTPVPGSEVSSSHQSSNIVFVFHSPLYHNRGRGKGITAADQAASWDILFPPFPLHPTKSEPALRTKKPFISSLLSVGQPRQKEKKKIRQRNPPICHLQLHSTAIKKYTRG